MEGTLNHHGILGQKWGVRRYQNKDGTLTPAGKKRLAEKSDIESKQKDEPKKRTLSDLSDDEIRQLITRLELEKRYKELYTARTAKQESKARKFVMEVLENIGKNTLTNLGTQAANHTLGSLINKLGGVENDDAAKRIVNPQKGQSDKK